MPAGTSSFTVRVADAAGQDDTQALSIVINLSDPPSITTTTLPGGTVGQAYNQTLQATGGIGLLTWTISGGSLPALLSLSPAGVISGTPTNTGTTNFTVRVRDTLNQSDTQSLSIDVSAALDDHHQFVTRCQEVDDSYSRTMQRSGGVAPFTWSVTPPLPPASAWMRRPVRLPAPRRKGRQEQGTYKLTFTAQDSSTPTPQTANQQLGLTIAPP